MKTYRDFDDVTKKRLEKNHKKMEELLTDQEVKKAFQEVHVKQVRDEYICMVKNELTDNELDNAVIIFTRYGDVIRHILDAKDKNRDIKEWHLRYGWISPQIITAGNFIMSYMNKNMFDYMSASIDSNFVSKETAADIIIQETQKINESSIKNNPDAVAKAIVRIISADFAVEKFYQEKDYG